MSQLHGSAEWTVFLVDGFDMLTAKPKNVVWTVAAAHESSHGLGDRFDAVTPTGLTKLTLVQTGAFWDTTPGGIHDTFKTPSVAARTVMLGPAGNTAGAPMLVINGVVAASYEVVATVGQLTKGNVTYQVNGPASSGALAAPLAHYTGTIDTSATPSDGGIESPNGATLTVQATVFDAGTTTATIIVRHSLTGTSGWTDLHSFVVTGAPSVQTFAVAGVVHRYIALGGVTDGGVTVAVSVQRNP